MNAVMLLKRGMLTLCLVVLAAGVRAQVDHAQVPPPNDRLQVREFENLVVKVAVPSAEETIAVFGVDLYARNIQPVWVEVINNSDQARDAVIPGLTGSWQDLITNTAFKTGGQIKVKPKWGLILKRDR